MTAVLALGAALAALSVPLNRPWLATAGLFVAAAGALVRLGIGLLRGRLEQRRERAESSRRLRAPVGPVSEIDPTVIGVDPAAQDLLDGGRLPRYLPRNVDAELVLALTEAVDGRGSWLVVVVGASKVGKSRSLFHALRVCEQTCPAAKDLRVVAPVDGDALRALLLPGQGPRLGARSAVLWLDDVEPFLNQAVTWQVLQEWHRGGRGRIVVATYGGKGSDLVAEAGAGDKLTTAAGQLLQQAREIHMTTTTEAELAAIDRGAALRRRLTEQERALMARFGAAAFLVAGPALERKLVTARHAPGAPPCPEGVAVVRAAVDWARCGRTDPITDDILRRVWPHYLPPGSTSLDDDFARGVQWALRPVAGTVALLYRTGSYAAYDYVVRLVRDQAGAVGSRDEMWSVAVDTASPAGAMAVAVAAYNSSRLETAAAACTRARESAGPVTAAIAGYNLGVVLGELGRSEDAVRAYQQVIDRYGDDPAPALREQTAKALYNMGVDLGVLGRSEDAVRAYQQVIDRYGDDPAPALREQTAKALAGVGYSLGVLGRSEDAVRAYQQVIDRYGDDPAPALREQTAKALYNMGVRLGVLGRSEDAVRAYQQVIDRYGDDPAPALREQTAKALYNMGVRLGVLGRSEDAVRAYQQVIDRYGDDPAPALREQTAKALTNMGVDLGVLGRSEDAVRAYQQVIDRYGDDPAPALREQTAKALYNMGVRLGVLGRSEDAVRAYQHVIDRYGDDPAPALREQTAKALYNMGVRLGVLGRSEDAVRAYQQVIDRYGDDPAPALREQTAQALTNMGVDLGVLGRSEDAVRAYQHVIDRYGDDPAPALREQTAKALTNMGVRLGVLGRSEDAVRAYQHVIDRYGDDPAPALREQTAKALTNMGVRLGVLGRSEDAVRAYQQVIDRYGDDPAPALREQTAKALYNMGVDLGVLGRSEDAVRAYQQVIDRYGDDPAPALHEAVSRAGLALDRE